MNALTDPTHEESGPDRFWTTINTLEATPLVLTAMDWSFWKQSLELATMRSFFDMGLVTSDQVGWSEDADGRTTASFFGRQSVNVDRGRWLMGSVPGTNGDEVEQALLGEVRPGIVDPPRKVSPLRMARGFVTSLRRHHRDVVALSEETRKWWRQRIEHPESGGTPSDRLVEARQRQEDTQYVHVRGRALLHAMSSQLEKLAADAGGPTLVVQLTSGVGDVEETRIVDELWDVAHGELDMDGFLARHGYHGHGEGNLSATVWRQDPGQVERLLGAYADMPASDRPAARVATTQSARETAVEEFLSSLSLLKRPLDAWLLKTTVTLTRDLERSKASFLMAIDAGRAAAHARGEELARAQVIDRPADVLHLTVEEAIDTSVRDRRELVAFRQERHAYHCTVRPPDKWVGKPEALPLSAGTTDRPEVIEGLAGSPGSVEGLARVVRDPAVDELPAPGEILVCATTDPSWAPVFVVAEGLVIDIGGPASHGAIVARELGVPCVINTETGTVRIRTGDRVIVDGDAGIVHIVERVGETAPPQALDREQDADIR